MSAYLKSAVLRRAVDRLGSSRAHVRMIDFLIFRRALYLQGDGGGTSSTASLELSTTNAVYMQAIRDLMEWPVQATDPAERRLPYYNPFGTAAHKDRGYRSPKYPSNGASVTARGIEFQRIIVLTGERPSKLSFKPNYEENLSSVVLKASGPLPLLVDVAAWYHRARDVSGIVGNGAAAAAHALMERTTEELGLTPQVVPLLFDAATPTDFSNA